MPIDSLIGMSTAGALAHPQTRELEACPGCGGTDLEPLPITTDVEVKGLREQLPILIDRSDYHLCSRCELVFARHRHHAQAGRPDFDTYLEAFIEAENREYASYPPPLEFVRNQVTNGCDEAERLAAVLPLRPGMRVLHVRCESGALLAYVRSRFGIEDVHGLDYFESNLRYAREDLRLPDVRPMRGWSVDPSLFDTRFDIIVANHQMTHALDPQETLTGLMDLVADDGVLLLVGEVDHANFLARYGSPLRGVNAFHAQLYTRNSLLNTCRAAGLQAELLHYHSEGLQWARPHCSMTVIARRGGRPDPFETDLDAWRSAFQAWQRRGRPPHPLRRLLGR